MQAPKTTLKDIAQRAGVSLSTVHKALYNKTGISEKVKNEIVEIAAQMGYRTNYVASSLKRKPIKIAFVMPLPDLALNRFFYQDVWKGLRQFKPMAQEFNVEFLEFGFSGPMDQLPKKLEEVYRNAGDDIAGLVTIATEHPAVSYFIDRFLQKNTAVVFVSSDLAKSERLCCVRGHDTMAGSLAAELLHGFTGGKGSLLIAAGDPLMSSHYLNVQGFQDFLSEYAPQTKLIKLYGDNNSEKLYEEAAELLRQDTSISGLYSCNARGTLPLCRAAKLAEHDYQIIGSDLFRESSELLKDGTLKAILYKNPQRMAYLACKTIFNYLVKNEFPHRDNIFVSPVAVLKSNLPHYDHDFSALQDE